MNNKLNKDKKPLKTAKKSLIIEIYSKQKVTKVDKAKMRKVNYSLQEQTTAEAK